MILMYSGASVKYPWIILNWHFQKDFIIDDFFETFYEKYRIIM